MADVKSTNVRQSFFGGVVSTRLLCQNVAGSIAPIPSKGKSKSRGTKHGGADGTGNSPAAAPPVAPGRLREADRAAIAAKRKAAAEKRKARLADEERSADAAIRSGSIKQQPPAPVASAASAGAVPPRAAPRPDVRFTAGGQRIVTHRAPAISHSPQCLARPPPKAAAKAKAASGKFPKNATVTTAAAAALAHAPADAPGGAVPLGSKQCRRCSAVRRLSDFFVDKRIEGGFMNYCVPCAGHNGLSGRRPTAAEVASAIAQSQPASIKRGAAPKAPAAAAPRSTGSTQGFYAAGGGGRAPPRPAPAIAAVRSGAHKRPRTPDLDTYDDDFVEDDVDGEDNWRQELLEVTRGFYREDRGDEPFNDRAMLASAADIRREEARSRRIGRQEDLEAEREELRHAAAKESKLARARKRRKARLQAQGTRKAGGGGAKMFLDDGGEDEDDDDAELSLSE